MRHVDLEEVRLFWEKNPLFQGESNFEPGTSEYFEEHRKVYIEDCFAGVLDGRLFPENKGGRTLDLGCGPGFWTVEFLLSGHSTNMHSADLTYNALLLTKKRLNVYKESSIYIQANAEMLPYKSESFDHVNCQGTIHHTPKTEKCVSEIARVLKSGGRAIISVYYKNILLRNWDNLKLKWLGRLWTKAGAKMIGRGRENLFFQDDVNEIVRLYDGIENPLGKAYSKNDFISLLSSYFEIEEIFYHYFPARTFPFYIPKLFHRFLDSKLPFMIFAKLKKDVKSSLNQ